MNNIKEITELIDSLEDSFEELIGILKSLSKDQRLRILIYLLTGEKKFDDLLAEIKLAKTALSNNLSKLLNANMIKKPRTGIYKITDDGELFLRAIDYAYINSSIKEKKDIKIKQQRKFSESFVEDFFG